MEAITLRIDGMHCGACLRRVASALQQVEGTRVQEVRLGAARVDVEDAAVAAPSLVKSVAKAGYSAHVEK